MLQDGHLACVALHTRLASLLGNRVEARRRPQLIVYSLVVQFIKPAANVGEVRPLLAERVNFVPHGHVLVLPSALVDDVSDLLIVLEFNDAALGPIDI